MKERIKTFLWYCLAVFIVAMIYIMVCERLWPSVPVRPH